MYLNYLHLAAIPDQCTCCGIKTMHPIARCREALEAAESIQIYLKSRILQFWFSEDNASFSFGYMSIFFLSLAGPTKETSNPQRRD